MKSLTGIKKVTFDAVKAEDLTTRKQFNEALREKIKEVVGGEWNYYSFMDKKYQVFEIIADMFPVAVQASLAGKFERFADFHDTAMGDQNVFTVEDNEIYPVWTASRGNGDIERQKIVDRKFTVPTQTKSIKFYDELDRFMAGDITVDRMTMKAVDAHGNYVGSLISDTIYNSYSAVGTNYKFTGAYDADELNTIIEGVKAATGADRVQIFGTTTALSNVADIAGYSDAEILQFNGQGYYGSFRGNDLIALPQAYKAGVDPKEFAVSSNHLIILPADQKIVKVAFEGAPFVGMQEGLDRNDKQIEILYDRRVGASAITVTEGLYGLYFFS